MKQLTEKEETFIRNRLSHISEHIHNKEAGGLMDLYWAHNTIKKLLLIIYLNKPSENVEYVEFNEDGES